MAKEEEEEKIPALGSLVRVGVEIINLERVNHVTLRRTGQGVTLWYQGNGADGVDRQDVTGDDGEALRRWLIEHCAADVLYWMYLKGGREAFPDFDDEQ